MKPRGVCLSMTADVAVFDPVFTVSVGGAIPYWTIEEQGGVKYNYSSLTPIHNRIVAGVMTINCYVDANALTGVSISNKGLIGTFDVTELTELTDLRLQSNALTDVGVVTSLTKLSILYLNGNLLTNIGVINELTDLTYLWLYTNSLTNIGTIDKLTNLIHLRAYGNSLTSIGSLDNKLSIQDVNVANNSLTTSVLDTILSEMYSARNDYTYATPVLDISINTGSPPNGVYADATPPTTGLEYAFKLVTDPDVEGFNTWGITY